MHQLQVFNPNDGKWYEMEQAFERDDAAASDLIALGTGDSVGHRSSMIGPGRRHTLIPIDPPREYTLGVNIIAGISPELRPRLTLECRPPFNDEWYLCDEGAAIAGGEGTAIAARIILSPPEPEPKTADELLADISQQIFEALGKVSTVTVLHDLRSQIIDHLAAQPERQEKAK